MDNGDLLGALKIDRSQREDIGKATPRWPWWIGAAVVVALLAAAGWWMLGQRPVAVRTAIATSPSNAGQAGAVLQATGYITARRQATVSAQITGTLTEVLIEEGDHVERGQVLARLEDSGYRANLDAAKAAVQAARAQGAQLQAQLGQARNEADRATALADRGLLSHQAAEQANTTVDVYTAQLNAQRQQERVAQAQAALAQVNYDYTVVRAPFAGVVTDKAAQIGEIVSPLSAGGGFTRTGVGTIVDMDSLEVDVDVNEAYIGRVQPRMPAEAVLDAYPDWKIPAHVIAIVPAADRGKATIKVRVALEQTDARIVPDMGVRVSFLEQRAKPTTQAPRGVLLPPAAVVRRRGQEVVFVLQEGKVRQRNVSTTGFGDQRLVPSGLQAGDTVVLAPPAALADGAAVTVEK